MTTAPADQLDVDELLHLAMHAANAQRHEDAIALLKRALALAPRDARLLHMLGAEHAQIGLYDRALKELDDATTLDPSMTVARFQLGLLHLSAGRIADAEAAWSGLDAALPTSHFLNEFKTGLLHIARNEFEVGATHLRRGIDANHFNAALNDDMRNILQRAEAGIGSAAGDATRATASSPIAPRPARLSAYRTHDEDNPSH